MNIQNSARLSYEFMSSKDAELFYELDQDTEVMRYINGGRMTPFESIHSTFIPRLEKYSNQAKGWGLWKVSLTMLDKAVQVPFLGWILVRPMDFFTDTPQWDNLEIGWRFKQIAWGKGYATEAAQAVIAVVTQEPHLNVISAIALEENLGSINIMKKLGMTFLKTECVDDSFVEGRVVYYQKSLSVRLL
ncbi:GNAT family N-acetyltransferase [Shewanella sp. D64]|uniref:GNAT family N-acetyltransferase n=1 Tax=unclassified Shewanella TaxID=196818 RepID=UPI0022BA2AB1|nr:MULTISPECIES: GNAT family N-acetyltransferase [unclassified Shewanella]MEC4724045.1 GNAT family N-acetyltransferase [Shewanella sp. D64]MEC4736065.1 GNAT family N-acetyltransferase [Shewanella sp. E94]WBJ97991.1 GNAT family N-acetyltransferase [Shewanella sp. MTB7]